MVTLEGCWPRMPPRLPRHREPAPTPTPGTPTRGTTCACAQRVTRISEDARRIATPDLLSYDVADHGSGTARSGERSSGDAIANVGDRELTDRRSLHVQHLTGLRILNLFALVIDGEGLAFGETSRASGIDRNIDPVHVRHDGVEIVFAAAGAAGSGTRGDLLRELVDGVHRGLADDRFREVRTGHVEA